MRRTHRAWLITTAVVAAFGITYLAFAPHPSTSSRPSARLAGVGVTGIAARGEATAANATSQSPEETLQPTATAAPSAPAAPAAPASATSAPPAASVSPAAEQPAPDFAPEEGVDHFRQGRQLFWERDYAAAAFELERATRQRPGTYYPHYLLGLTYHRLGNDVAAEREYVAAKEIDGELPEALVNLTRLYLDIDVDEEAMELALQATEVAPQSDSAWNVLGRCHLAFEELDDAIAAFGEACRLNEDNAYAWNNLGYAHILAGDFETALAPLETAVSRKGDVAYMHNNLGVALERLGRFEEAYTAYMRAANVDPMHDRAVQSAERLALVLESRAATRVADNGEGVVENTTGLAIARESGDEGQASTANPASPDTSPAGDEPGIAASGALD